MVAYKALKALANTEMTLFAQDLELRYLWLFNAENSWLSSARNGDIDHDFLSGPAAEKSNAIKSEILRTHKPARFELPFLASDSMRWFDIRIDVDRDESGTVIGVIGTSLEITEQKRREETLKTLLREVRCENKQV